MGNLAVVKTGSNFLVVPYDIPNKCWDFDKPVGVFNSSEEAHKSIKDKEKD